MCPDVDVRLHGMHVSCIGCIGVLFCFLLFSVLFVHIYAADRTSMAIRSCGAGVCLSNLINKGDGDDVPGSKLNPQTWGVW